MDQEPGAQTLYISTPSKTPVNFTVRYAGVEGATATSGKVFESSQVDNNNPYEVVIAGAPVIMSQPNYSELFVNPSEVEIPLNKGINIEADSEIYVSYRFISSSNPNQAAAIVSKGISGSRKRFRAGMLLKIIK